MIDFKIQKGLSTTLFTPSGKVNPRLIIEEGCWYLCIDTADLFLGINDNGTLKLKRINESHTSNTEPGQGSEINGIVKAEINSNGDLVVYYSNGESSILGHVLGSDGEDGVATSIRIGDTVYTHNEGIIELPNFVTEDFLSEKLAEIKLPEMPTKVSELENDAGYITGIPDNYLTKEYNNAVNRAIKYEVIPRDGVLVAYRDNEIRVNTSRVQLTDQQAGPTAPTNQYYIPFRAYAPEGAVAFKEWQGDVKDDTLHTFDESFSGVDQFGRNYSLIWMSIASFDGKNWSLYGDLSTADKYLGFYYTFEWYNADNKLIDTDTVRIILTNDACHNELVSDAVVKRIDEKIAAIEIPEIDLEDYATKTFVKAAIAEAELDDKEVDLSGYATKDDIKDFASKPYVAEQIANIDIPKVPTKVSEFENDANYVSKEQLRGFATEKFVEDAISKINIPEVDLTDYAKKIDIPDITGLASKSDIPDVSSFISEIPSEYITESELDEKGYLTEHQSLAGLATEIFVKNAIAEAELNDKDVDLSGYATKDDLIGLATETYVDTKIAAIEIPTVPTKVSELENDAGYLTEHQDLSNFYTKEDIAQGYYNKTEVDSIVNEAIDDIEVPEVPTKVSDLQNDIGYVTDDALDASLNEKLTQALDMIILHGGSAFSGQ